jgi:hypothetical protein
MEKASIRKALICQLYWWQNFPPVSLTPVVHLDLQISPRIFDKIWNNPNVISRGLREDDSWKNPNKKSRGNVPLNIFLVINGIASLYAGSIDEMLQEPVIILYISLWTGITLATGSEQHAKQIVLVLVSLCGAWDGLSLLYLWLSLLKKTVKTGEQLLIASLGLTYVKRPPHWLTVICNRGKNYFLS